MHTPVVASPANNARSTGAAPRQRGKSEKCTLIIGNSASTPTDDAAVRDHYSEIGTHRRRVGELVTDTQPEFERGLFHRAR